MSRTDDIADEMAQEALELERETGDEALVKQVASAIAGFSPTMEESFLTAVRIRRAEARGPRGAQRGPRQAEGGLGSGLITSS